LAIKAQQRPLCGKALGLDGGLDGDLCLAQFLALVPIAGVTKAGHPLLRMHLQDGCARANDFPSLASGVAGGTPGTQTPLGSRSIWRLRQRPLPRRFARPIHVEDQPTIPLSIPQSGVLLFGGKTACQQIFQKNAAQGFDRFELPARLKSG
jgi:hypothetical protein